MSENKENVPKIRFPGFTDAWEQRKLGDEVQIKDSARIPNALWKKDGVPYLRSSNLDNATDEMLYISQKDYEIYKSKTGAPELGDVLFNSGGNIGTAILKSDDKPVYVQGGAVLYIKTSTSKKLDGMYLKYYFETPVQKKYILQTCVGGTIKHFTLVPANAMPITYPKTDEQIRIGAFFNTLDNLIALHQRKLNNVQNLKAGLLQKMFPKDGEDYPEVRFPGFTSAWEQRKAVDIFKTTADKNHPELPVLSATQEYGMILREDTGINIAHDKKNEATYKRVLPGQFVMHLRSFQGGFAHANVEGITSPAYTVMAFVEQERHNDFFWKYIFSSEKFVKSLEKVTYGIRDGRSISYADFCTMDFKFPSIGEQRAIGQFFQNLDHLITLHQRKLKHLQDQKKALLQQMFV